MRKLVSRAIASAVILTCTSCEQKEQATYPVSGVVTYKGSPASGAVVVFHRRGDSASDNAATGVVQQDGTFELVSGAGKGAMPGDYVVLVEWKGTDQRQRRGPDKLKGRYADPKRPRFHVTIKPERNDLPPFELTD